MTGPICSIVVACAVATIWHFRGVVREIVEGVIQRPGRYGAGLLAATLVTFETAHDLALYAFVAPTVVALNEYGEL